MKKVVAIVLLAACVVCVLVGGKYIKESGILRKYPDPEYLSDSEAAKTPFYSELSKKEKAVYTALKKGIGKHKTDIALPYELNGDSYSAIYCMLEKQEPQFFYLDSKFYTADKIRDAEILYRIDGDELDKMADELAEAELDAVDEALEYSSDYEKALAIHDYLLKNCSYLREDDDGYSSTVYGCLVEGEANCEGYAKAFDLIAGDVGLPCVVIVGETDDGENHAWNQVKIEGDWYNVDVTWDDTDRGDEVSRGYFLCDDEQFLRTHEADENVEPFECDEQKYNYYIYNKLYADSMDEAEKIVRRQIAEGSDEIELRFSDDELCEDFKDEYINEQYIFDVIFDEEPQRYGKITVNTRENEKEDILVISIE